MASHEQSDGRFKNTTLAPFAPLREEDHHHTLAPFAPLRGEGLGMRGDGKFEAGSGKFESSALDQAIMKHRRPRLSQICTDPRRSIGSSQDFGTRSTRRSSAPCGRSLGFERGIELGGDHHHTLLPSPRLRGEGSGVRSLLRDFV